MGYLAKAKLVPPQKINDSTEQRLTNLTNLTEKESGTAETTCDKLRTNTPESKTKREGVTIQTRLDTIPRLPFALERLVAAAGGDLLSGFTFAGVPDINNYVRALVCDYVIGDQQHALDRLHQVQIAREASS